MSENNSTELLKKLYVQLQALKAENEALKNQLYQEPVALIGVGCRFPDNVNSLSNFIDKLASTSGWQLGLPDQRDYFGQAEKHWLGGFIADADHFDPEFFGISSQEAAELDPQQRLLLETAYRTLEAAGYRPSELRGTSVGVFVGMSTDDYQLHTIASRKTSSINAYNTLGTARSVAAGRIAYCFDFRGPVLQVDTACSSSLMAVHLACQSLQNNEASMALAGGVNLMLAGETYATREALGALSPSGRCHTFADQADGYARSEGCGFVLLKTLSAAVRDGDIIHSVIYASSVNHDGRSNGLTAPNGDAQRQLFAQSLKKANLAAEQLSYVETHGTGTRLGDPIELHAIGDVFANSREKPLLVGSLKSGLGHMEAAAGIASLIKTTALLACETLYPDSTVNAPNSLINWKKYPISLISQPQAWPRMADQPRYAAINAFGLSGTNVNLIVGDATAISPSKKFTNSNNYFLCVSGKTERAFLKNIFAMERAVAITDELESLLVASCLYRDHHPYKRAFYFSGKGPLLTELRQTRQYDHVDSAEQNLIWIFSGTIANAQLLLRQLLMDNKWILDEITPLLTDGGLNLSDSSKFSDDWSSVILQFAIASAYSALGIKPKFLAGTGTGILAMALFSKQINVAQAKAILALSAPAKTMSVEVLSAILPETLPRSTHPLLLQTSHGVKECERLTPADFVAMSNETVINELPSGNRVWLGQGDISGVKNNLSGVDIQTVISPVNNGALLRFNESVADLYNIGEVINFSRLYPSAQKIFTNDCPPYSFDSKPYWTRVGAPDAITQIPQTYQLHWQEFHRAATSNIDKLLVLHSHPVSRELRTAIEQGAHQVEFLECPDNQLNTVALATAFADAFTILDLRWYSVGSSSACASFSYDFCVDVLQQVTETIQALIELPARYHLVVPALEAEYSLALMPLRGLLRSASHEQPALIGTFILADEADFQVLMTAVASTDNYECFRISTNHIYVERLQNAPQLLSSDLIESTEQPALPAALWIVGGLGSLGLELAKERVRQGACQLLLTGRNTELQESTVLALADLRAAGAEIYVEAVDVSDYSALHQLASRFGKDLPAIDAIIHAAGVSEFCPVTALTRNDLDKLCRAKIAGGWNLHRISEEFPVNHFILYSSISSTWGSVNLAHYAAANGFLDALAEFRHAQNLPAVVVNWGPWANVGMAARDAQRQVESLGLLPLAADSLANVYHRIFSFPDSLFVVCNLDMARFQAAIEVRHAVPLLAPIFGVVNTEEAIAPANVILPYLDLNARERTRAIQRFLQEQLARMLNFSAGKLPAIDDPLHQLGVDSLMAVDLTSVLSSHFQRRLPATLIFDYPSIMAMTEFIHSTVYPRDAAADDVLNPDMEAELLKALQDFSIDLLDEVADNI
ncbi:MAG: hypothetical protein B0W54_24175 [Cellvibrio sp. 79]|nr:MAG: hypothetical protein B0W54_24175 [Cellvibrio sp. 79]